MKIITIAAIIFMCLTNAMTARADNAHSESLLMLQQRCLLLRSFEERLSSSPKEQAQSTATALVREMAPIVSSDDKLGSDFFRYYSARLLVTTGNRREGEKLLVALAGSPTVAPEAVDAFFEVQTTRTKELLQQPFILLGRLLPFSIEEKLSRGLHQNPRPRFRFTKPADTPQIREAFLVEIADDFLEMKMFGMASDAYLEAIYVPNSPLRIFEPSRSSWLSSALWIKAAEAEWQQGNEQKMATFIAKAIVFGSEATKNDALKQLTLWRTTDKPLKPSELPEGTKLKRIADLYAQMQMQPRAIQIVKRFAPSIGTEAKPLQSQYQNEWISLMEPYCAGREGKCWVYGQDVSQKETWLQVVIHPPLRPEALQLAAKTVAALAKEKT